MKNKKTLSEVDIQRVKAAQTICIGIVAKNMKYADLKLVTNAGKDLFFFIKNMTYKQFSNIKKAKI